MEDKVEIEEWYKDGRVVRRYINGKQVEPDSIPSAIQFCDFVVTKKYMTPEELKHFYGKAV